MARATVALASLALALAAASPAAAKDGDGEARAVAQCRGGAIAELRLKADDGEIEVRFRIRGSRLRDAWRVTLVHERRVVWRGAVRVSGESRSSEVRRALRDLPGDDMVTAHAWGPRGLTCRATATLAED